MINCDQNSFQMFVHVQGINSRQRVRSGSGGEITRA